MSSYTDKNSKAPTDVPYALSRASSRIPGFDDQQIPYIDSWGRTEPSGDLFKNVIDNFLNPAYVSKENVTPVDGLVSSLYEKTGESSVVPKRVDKSNYASFSEGHIAPAARA